MSVHYSRLHCVSTHRPQPCLLNFLWNSNNTRTWVLYRIIANHSNVAGYLGTATHFCCIRVIRACWHHTATIYMPTRMEVSTSNYLYQHACIRRTNHLIPAYRYRPTRGSRLLYGAHQVLHCSRLRTHSCRWNSNVHQPACTLDICKPNENSRRSISAAKSPPRTNERPLQLATYSSRRSKKILRLYFGPGLTARCLQSRLAPSFCLLISAWHYLHLIDSPFPPAHTQLAYFSAVSQQQAQSVLRCKILYPHSLLHLYFALTPLLHLRRTRRRVLKRLLTLGPYTFFGEELFGQVSCPSKLYQLLFIAQCLNRPSPGAASIASAFNWSALLRKYYYA